MFFFNSGKNSEKRSKKIKFLGESREKCYIREYDNSIHKRGCGVVFRCWPPQLINDVNRVLYLQQFYQAILSAVDDGGELMMTIGIAKMVCA